MGGSQVKPAPGVLIGGSIRLEKVIDPGHPVVTYAATHARTGPTAVRVFEGEMSSTELYYFEREAMVLRALPHNRHRPRYLGHGLADGTPFMMSDPILGTCLDRMLTGGRTFDEDFSIALVSQVCDALADLHKMGGANCTIHPANIFVARDASGHAPIRAMLTGWGRIHDSQGLMKLADQGDLVVDSFIEAALPELDADTAEYIAPEQFWVTVQRSQSSNRTGPASDVFALAILMHRLLTGKVPWPYTPPENSGIRTDSSAVKVYLHERSDGRYSLQRPPSVSAGLWSILQRALHREPEHRQADGRELMGDLKRYAETGRGVQKIPAALRAVTMMDPTAGAPPPVPGAAMTSELPTSFAAPTQSSAAHGALSNQDAKAIFAAIGGDLPAGAFSNIVDHPDSPSSLKAPSATFTPLVMPVDEEFVVGEVEETFPTGLRRKSSSSLQVWARDLARRGGEEWDEPHSESWLERIRATEDPQTRRVLWAFGGFAMGLTLYVVIPILGA
ncbi:MAG: serine/threonine protein kinase [Myxococcota bacterium]|jgi:serine/threonine protein kinase